MGPWSSDSDTSFSERWKDQIARLQAISSSLNEGGVIRENHFIELQSVGRGLTRDEISDLESVIKDTAQARMEQNGTTDKVAAQVQNVLKKIEVARGAARFLEDALPLHLNKDPRKREIPGKERGSSCGRASSTFRGSNHPGAAVNEVILAY